MGVSVEVEGLPVQSTPLASAWTTVEQDLARTLAGNPVRRIIEIDVADGEIAPPAAVARRGVARARRARRPAARAVAPPVPALRALERPAGAHPP